MDSDKVEGSHWDCFCMNFRQDYTSVSSRDADFFSKESLERYQSDIKSFTRALHHSLLDFSSHILCFTNYTAPNLMMKKVKWNKNVCTNVFLNIIFIWGFILIWYEVLKWVNSNQFVLYPSCSFCKMLFPENIDLRFPNTFWRIQFLPQEGTMKWSPFSALQVILNWIRRSKYLVYIRMNIPYNHPLAIVVLYLLWFHLLTFLKMVLKYGWARTVRNRTKRTHTAVRGCGFVGTWIDLTFDVINNIITFVREHATAW